MKFYRIWAVARKEFIHVMRDPRSLGMAIAIPMLLLMLFGYALTLDVDNVPVVVWDQSQTPASRALISHFSGSRYFSIRSFVQNYRELERNIDSARALAGIVIPRDFASQISGGHTVKIQMIVDGSDANTAAIAMGYARVITMTYSQNLVLDSIHLQGQRSIQAPLDLKPRVWFNTDMESKNYIIPGLIAVIMMVIAALLTSLTVAREWESGTMEQLISTPVRGKELIIGKLFPYFVIGMFDVVIAVVMGEFLFQVPLRGNVALLFSMAAIFLIGALSLGMLISIATRSQLLASQLAMVLTFLPAFLLSGFMYAISNMPIPVQIITHIVPARYFVALLKGIYLKGVGLEVLGMETLFLTMFGIIVFVIANKKFRKKVA